MACIGALLVVGCSDNPQNKAAKQLRENTEKALDKARQGDIDEAAKAVQSALRGAPGAGPSAEPALLVLGDLTFEQAKRQRSTLASTAIEANAALDDISVQVRSIRRLQAQQDRLNSILAAIETEIKEFSSCITGDSQKPGIEAKLAAEKAEFSLLEGQKAEYEQQRQQAQAFLEDIQQRADEKIRLSESLQGNEQIELAQAGYDLLLSRKKHFLDSQQALDLIQSVESRIAIIQPSVQKLESDIDSISRQISEIRNSPAGRESREQLLGVNKQIEVHNGRIALIASVLQEAQTGYTRAVDETIKLFKRSAENYKKVRSQAGRKPASIGQADAYAQIALAQLEGMKFHHYFSSRLSSIGGVLTGQSADTLDKVGSLYTNAASDYAQSAKESFDLAAKEYSNLQKRYASGRNQLACDIIKNYILVLHGKMVLSEYLGEQDVIDEVLAQVDVLVEKAQKCDPAFARSITSNLITGTTPFVPTLSVDSTIYYTGLKDKFQAWKQLPGAEKEAEINRLLAMLDEMGQPEDPETFNRIIGPERQQLEAALKALQEGPAAGDAGLGYDEYDEYSDPNYF
ncbi:MAG: hypothetical protein ACYTFK_06195 [Planctomycetota bacterium]